jgi:hypothetical protein
MLMFAGPCAAVTGRQPSRTYYQMLDISPDERNLKVIEEAALRCSSRVRTYQLTAELECTQGLNEIAHALMTLIDPVRRREYDLGLGTPPDAALLESKPTDSNDSPVLLRDKLASLASDRSSFLLLLVEDHPCDVRLVHRRSLRKGAP